MAALQAFGGTGGVLVLAGSGFMPARLLLVPAGTRLPPGMHAVAAVPATAVVASVGSGSRAMGHAAAGADHGIPSGVLSSLSIGDATKAGVLTSLSLDDATKAGVLASLSIGDATGAAAGGAARGSAGGGGLLFLCGDASAGFGFGISSAALASASAAGGRASRGGELVVAATGGSEAEGGDDKGSTADCTKGSFVFYDFIATQGLDALWVLDEIVPSTAKAELASKFTEVETTLNRAVVLAGQGHSDKMDCALRVVRGWYGILDLAHAAYPSAGLPALPGEQAFLSMCLGLAADDRSPPVMLGQPVAPLLAALQTSKLLRPEMSDVDADLIKSVFVAVAVSQAAARTARASYVSGEPDIDLSWDASRPTRVEHEGSINARVQPLLFLICVLCLIASSRSTSL